MSETNNKPALHVYEVIVCKVGRYLVTVEAENEEQARLALDPYECDAMSSVETRRRTEWEEDEIESVKESTCPPDLADISYTAIVGEDDDKG
jgi:hypothetical protein